MDRLPNGEEVGHYWKTGSSAPEIWMEKTRKLIKDYERRRIMQWFYQHKEAVKS